MSGMQLMTSITICWVLMGGATLAAAAPLAARAAAMPGAAAPPSSDVASAIRALVFSAMPLYCLLVLGWSSPYWKRGGGWRSGSRVGNRYVCRLCARCAMPLMDGLSCNHMATASTLRE
jgi:hypothetical protein